MHLEYYGERASPGSNDSDLFSGIMCQQRGQPFLDAGFRVRSRGVFPLGKGQRAAGAGELGAAQAGGDAGGAGVAGESWRDHRVGGED